MRTLKSRELLERMSLVAPGAASSNARCGNAIAVAEGRGAELIDLDGNRYIDYILGFGPILLGHAHPRVAQAVAEALTYGTTFAFTSESEYSVCEQITSRCPSVEMVRLCNSGTDAATTAYRIACAHTGANTAVKIQGDYHGGFDLLMYDIPGVDASGFDLGPVPGSWGLIGCGHELAVTVPFNDADALEAVLRSKRGKIAAVFMEPILGNTAAILPKPGYLEAVRSLCTDYETVLVFDEVKTGFRVSPGGAQEHFGVYSDLTMYGKALANGLPLSAVGGRRDLMTLVGPDRVHHCGTFYGNLPCVAAAEAVLSVLAEADYEELARRAEFLAQEICCLLGAVDIPAHWQGVGSMFGITLGPQHPHDYRTWWLETDRELWLCVTNHLRELGVLADGFIGLFFLSFAHTDDHIAQTLRLCEEAIDRSL